MGFLIVGLNKHYFLGFSRLCGILLETLCFQYLVAKKC